ncbi:MAG: hypothetical protein ACYC0X_07395 [Pirellulaceae bacterium]
MKTGSPQAMWTHLLPYLFWCTIAIQLISVATIVAIQLRPRGRRRSACEQIFIGLMLAMGLVTVLAISATSDAWLASGATLSVMTVCATYDLGARDRQAASF